MSLTDEQVVEAAKLRAAGMSWGNLGARFVCDGQVVRYALDPEYAEVRRQQVKTARQKRLGTYEYRRVPRARKPRESNAVGHVVTGVTVQVPEQVMADRDRRLSMAPRSLTAAIFGDPLPGMSALDQRQSA